MRIALRVEKIVVELETLGAKAELIASVKRLYEQSYREGYQDAQEDLRDYNDDRLRPIEEDY